jgi:hypothetical protein
LAKINASYKIYYNSIASRFNIPGGNSSELEAFSADAEVFEHLFGLYGSMYFLGGSLGITAAYMGNLSVFLSEYYSSSVTGMVETAIPVTLKNGIGLNAMWNTPAGITFRTENSVSFWQDKDYDIFGTGLKWNLNLEDKKTADDFALVDHIVLMNGLGMSYPFTNNLRGNIFLENIYKRWYAHGRMRGIIREYAVMENTARVELGLTYNFNPNALVFAKLDVSYMTTSRSLDINAASLNFFVDKYQGKKPDPVATTDTVLTVRIPIGVTLKIQ